MKRLQISAIIIGLVVPVVITVVVAIVALSWVPELPAQVAVHWGPDGEPNEYSSPVGFVLGLSALAIVFAALFTGIVLGTLGAGVSWTQKILLATPVFISILMGTLLLVSLDGQRDLAEGSAAPSPVTGLLVGGAIGIAASIAAWFILPKAIPARDQYGPTPDAAPLTAGDRVLWVRSISAATPIVIVVVAIGIIAVVGVLISGASFWFAALVLLLMALAAGSLSWRVRIDGRGVLVRSVIGLPRFFIPLAEIASASVPVVSPLVEFGGWGLRFGAGKRVGVILRSSDAVEVHRRSGSSLVVTIDDAVVAASLVNGLVAQAAARHS